MKKEEFLKTESLDEIVFENRNKEYGAYDLRMRYKKNLNRSMFIAFVFLLIISGTPFIMALQNQDRSQIITNDINIDLMDVDTDRDDVAPPPPPPPPPLEDKLEQQVKFTAPEVVDSTDDDASMGTNDDLLKNIKNDDLPPVIDDTPPEILKPADDDVAVPSYVVEEQPRFPGGEEALLKFIAEHTIYPDIPKENNVQGKVHLEFEVKKDGSIGDVKILRGVDPYIDAEAIRVIKSLPKWEPGRQGGNPVKVTMQIPINFVLN